MIGYDNISELGMARRPWKILNAHDRRVNLSYLLATRLAACDVDPARAALTSRVGELCYNVRKIRGRRSPLKLAADTSG